MDNGEIPFTTTNIRTIGTAIFALLSSTSNYASSQNRYIHIESYTTTQVEILDVLENITGKAWERIHESGKELLRWSHEEYRKGNLSYEVVEPQIQVVSCGKLDEEGLGDLRGENLFNDQLLLPKENLEADIRVIAAGQKLGPLLLTR
jgi:hypothetical protein